MSNQDAENDGGTLDPQYAPVPKVHQARVARLVDLKKSLSYAARLLHLSELTVAKVVGGQNVSRAMRALIAQTLAERDVAGKVP